MSFKAAGQTEHPHMTTAVTKLGLGGGCHWCTEGVFASLLGVARVNQGWIAAQGQHGDFSEAIEVVFDPAIITLSELIEIHLHTHASTAKHSMRDKYRSAIYTYGQTQYQQAISILELLGRDFEQELITQVYPFKAFKSNKAELSDYFYTAPSRPFCQRYIHPKLKMLLAHFSQHVDKDKLAQTGLNLD